MANVIKLTDTYVDASSVYDTNQSKTQADINASNKSSIETINSNYSSLKAFPSELSYIFFDFSLGTSWDGTAKTTSVTVPESGNYLICVWVHICGSNAIAAGSSVLFQGGIFEDYLGFAVPLSRDWDKYNNACTVKYISAGTKTITISGTFQGNTSNNTYGSSGYITLYKLSA